MLTFTKTVFDYHFCNIVTVSERDEKIYFATFRQNPTTLRM